MTPRDLIKKSELKFSWIVFVLLHRTHVEEPGGTCVSMIRKSVRTHNGTKLGTPF